MTKYRSRRVEVNGITYDSKREANRHQELLLMERAGLVRELRSQVQFELVPGVRIEGEKRARPPMRYTADFVYLDESGAMVVEDAKGMQTKDYRMRKHLMKAVHNISVKEV